MEWLLQDLRFSLRGLYKDRASAGLMMRSFFLMRQADLGFQPQKMVTTQIRLNNSYKTAENKRSSDGS